MNKQIRDAVIEGLELCSALADAPEHLTPQLIQLWVAVLVNEGVKAELIRPAFLRHIGSQKWFPRPADIVAQCNGGDSKESLEIRATVAWQKCLSALRSLGTWATWLASDVGGDRAALWCVSRLGDRFFSMETKDRHFVEQEFRRLYAAAVASGFGIDVLPGELEINNLRSGISIEHTSQIGRPELQALPPHITEAPMLPAPEPQSELTGSVEDAIAIADELGAKTLAQRLRDSL